MSLRGRQVTTSITPTCRFVIVTIGGVRFAIQGDYVKGLLTAEEAGFLEDLTVQGVTYPAGDVAAAFQLSKDPQGPESRIILFSKGEGRASIHVAEVHGLKDVDESQVLPLPAHFRSEERTWYRGMVLFEDGVAMVLDPDWLIGVCVAHPGMGNGADSRRQTPFPVRPALAGKQV
jgi:hypothetical protein